MSDHGFFLDRMNSVVSEATDLAKEHNHPCVGCEHIAIALLRPSGDTILSGALKDRSVDLDSLLSELESALEGSIGGQTP
jgi:ATP-dependent Clp protease ATP-binding subunit ClpA